ncbi:hypothetical protein BDP27DRAFT_1406784 [Rhodocollybia butyracea]|uniref:AMP-dependent synthetase/ligase domain-containing protein n=1 Tax=Rhodocollybia butyracea TaxID=206335 RepID=A0A9P5TZ68_9AGAR|nr:hypothetical protein BDP27DRAFT_1406784 [Rhodocollybia butyracea]
MSPLLTHLTNLEDATSRFPSRVAFKIPQQFLLDIEHLARYWFHVLKESNGIPQSLRGYKYIDVVHVYAISRAGYIPQLINIFPNADYGVIQGPLEQANTRAFIYEPVYNDTVHDIPQIPCFTSVTVVHPNDYPLPDLPHVTGSDIAIIYQTSGTTSGKSNIVPCNYAWLDGCVRKMTRACSDSGKVDIVSWRGSTGYMAQFRALIGIIYRTSCMVQYKSGWPSTSEIVDIINRCQTKQLFSHPRLLQGHIRASRTDPETLRALSSVDVITYTGGGLGSDEDEEWAWRNGINLVNAYGLTECGELLRSEGLRKSRQNYLKRLPGPTLIKFIPISNDSDLLELVVPPEAPECPHVSFRSSDGNYHTNDLFREVEPGSYVFCGRNDDWFNMLICKLCDTKAIEDNARSLCGDIISDCVVVGNGRLSPVLVVEACSPLSHSTVSPALNESELKTEIYHRIRLSTPLAIHTNVSLLWI